MSPRRDLEVLFLPRYERLGPSSRLRCYQYLPGLEALGIRGRVVPLLHDAYLKALYNPATTSISVASLVRAYLERLAACLGTRNVDLVWIERELLPWIPEPIDRIFRNLWRAPYVVDLDDAVFHRYDLHRLPLIRKVLGAKIDGLMKTSAMVVVGNDYLAARARAAGAQRVERLMTPVDTAKYDHAPSIRREKITVGWIGSPATVVLLNLVHNALAEVAKRSRIRVLIVGAEVLGWPDVPIENVAWTEETEAALVNEMDIGIMPLMDGPSERGKCGYKLIQYMASGVPVIASPVGVNKEIVQPGLNGFLAESDDDWIIALEKLIASPQLRSEMGAHGKVLAAENYSLSCYTRRLAELLRQAAS